MNNSVCVRVSLTELALVSLENLPGVHASHTPLLDPPTAVEYLPVPQPRQ